MSSKRSIDDSLYWETPLRPIHFKINVFRASEHKEVIRKIHKYPLIRLNVEGMPYVRDLKCLVEESANIVSQCPMLETVFLTSFANFLGYTPIIDNLINHPSIADLTLHHCGVSSDTCNSLCSLLETSTSLTSLSITYVALQFENISMIIDYAFNRSRSLTAFKLDMYDAAQDSVDILGKGIATNTRITKLHFGTILNETTEHFDTDFSPIKDALRTNDTLTDLSFKMDGIEQFSSRDILALFHSNTTLKTLKIDNSDMTEHKRCNLKIDELLLHNSTLTSLRISDSSCILDESNLENVLRNNTSLRAFTLHVSHGLSDEYTQMVRGLSRNTTLEYLNLHEQVDVSISPSDLYNLLTHNETLTHICISTMEDESELPDFQTMLNLRPNLMFGNIFLLDSGFNTHIINATKETVTKNKTYFQQLLDECFKLYVVPNPYTPNLMDASSKLPPKYLKLKHQSHLKR